MFEGKAEIRAGLRRNERLREGYGKIHTRAQINTHVYMRICMCMHVYTHIYRIPACVYLYVQM